MARKIHCYMIGAVQRGDDRTRGNYQAMANVSLTPENTEDPYFTGGVLLYCNTPHYAIDYGTGTEYILVDTDPTATTKAICSTASGRQQMYTADGFVFIGHLCLDLLGSINGDVWYSTSRGDFHMIDPYNRVHTQEELKKLYRTMTYTKAPTINKIAHQIAEDSRIGDVLGKILAPTCNPNFDDVVAALRSFFGEYNQKKHTKVYQRCLPLIEFIANMDHDTPNEHQRQAAVYCAAHLRGQ